MYYEQADWHPGFRARMGEIPADLPDIRESVLVKHQLLILNRSRERAPNLRSADRLIAGLCATMMRPTRLLRTAIVLKPSTIMSFHRALVKQKSRTSSAWWPNTNSSSETTCITPLN
jgi:hypothetical protein